MLMVEQLKSKFRRIRTTPLRRPHIFTRQVFHASFIMFLVNLLFFTPSFALLQSPDREIYAINDIKFYDGSVDLCSSGGSSMVYGNAATEKIWVGLTTIVGLTDEQAAGVMGNMRHESNFNPAQHEISLMQQYQPGFNLGSDNSVSYGLGLIQWSYGRRVKMYNYVAGRNPSLLEYLEDYQTYSYTYLSGDQFIALAGDAIADELIQYELEYLQQELTTTSSYKGIYDTTTVYDAAKFFLEHVEIPKNPYIGSHPERAVDAQAYYNLYHGTAISNSPSSNSSSSSNISKVTIIGDSITNRSKDAISAVFADTDIAVDIDAADGRQFTTGLEILDNIISHNSLGDVLIFALGTNNTGLKIESVRSVVNKVNTASPSTIVVFVTNYYYKDTDHYYQNNLKFQTTSNENRGTVLLADWAAAANANPDLYIDTADNYYVHPSYGEGVKLFAETITNFITNGTTSALSHNITNGCNDIYSGNGSGGVTTSTINGYEYAFPIANATKNNFLRNSNQDLIQAYGVYDHRCATDGMTWASCLSQPDSFSHHDYPAVDLGIWAERVDGIVRGPNNDAHWGGDSSISDPRWYLSSGATVVAFTSGTVTSAKHSYNASGVPSSWVNRCGSVTIQGNDGHTYYSTHLSADSILVSEGDVVTVGQPIAEVGAPFCAQSTQAHVHLDMDGTNGDSGRTSNSALTGMIRELYNALPQDAAELASREAAHITEGGLTYEQAKQFMIWYGTNKDDSSANATSSLWGYCNGGGSNCVTFSAFFINKFTNTRPTVFGNGYQVVSNMAGLGVPTGTTPQIWSVFSWSNGGNGHTGVILGYHDGQWIVGHASCSSTGIGAGNGTKEGGGSGFVMMSSDLNVALYGSSSATYAYFGNQVNTSAISQYLNTGT